MINVYLMAFRNRKNEKSYDWVEIRKFYERQCLYFYPIESLSFLVDKPDPRSIYNFLTVIWEGNSCENVVD